MPDTSNKQLQLDFQRRAPELCNDCSDLAAGASFALHDALLTSVTVRPAPSAFSSEGGTKATLDL